MMTIQKNLLSPLDREPLFTFVSDLIREGQTNATILRELRSEYAIDTTKHSLCRFRKRHDLQIPQVGDAFVRVNGDDAECSVVTEVEEDGPIPVLTDPDSMLQQRGLDPTEWYIYDVGVREWYAARKGGGRIKLYHTKLSCKRRNPDLFLRPVRSEGWTPPLQWWAPPDRSITGGSNLVVVCGDAQAPYHDKNLHRLFQKWLQFNRPVRGIDLGDLLDFPDISRHKVDPENIAYAQECMQVGYEILRDRVAASPGTKWEWLPGNHDIRLHDYEIQHAPQIAGLRLVDTDTDPGVIAHGLPHLMRLDELGVTFIDPHSVHYEDAQVNVGDIAIRHGWKARPGGGTSAIETLKATRYSILIGHSHKQSLIHHTEYGIDGTPKVLVGGEIGCMCRIDRRGEVDEKGRHFPTFVTLPDWQQGYVTIECYSDSYSDNTTKVDLATYDPSTKTLYWRDQRFQ